jgi:hypothetical protein
MSNKEKKQILPKEVKELEKKLVEKKTSVDLTKKKKDDTRVQHEKRIV